MTQQTAAKRPLNYMLIVFSLCITTMIAGMNGTIFNIALPALMSFFSCDIVTVQWITSGYMLAAGVIVPCSAYFASRFGYKRMLLFLLLFSLVCVVAGSLATSIHMLIGIRILLGLSGGLFSPLTLGMIYKIVPPYMQPKAASVYGMFAIVGGALPLVIGGVLITYLSWRWLFWLFIPIILLGFFAIYHYVPNDELTDKSPLDIKGFFLTVVGSFILLFAFSNLSKWGFSQKFFLFCSIGILLMIVYFKLSWGNDNAMLNLDILRYPRFNAAIVIAVIETVSMYMVIFSMPLFLQKGLGYSAFSAGMIMLPMTLVTVMAMPFGTKIMSAQGEKILSIVGLSLLMISSVFFFKTHVGMSLAILLMAVLIRGVGLAFTNLLTTNTVMSSVPPSLSTHASAFSNWVRQMVGAFITSLTGNIIGLQLALRHAETPKQISDAYLSSMSLVMMATFLLLTCCMPLALKYFRSKAEMQAVMKKSS